MELFGRFKDEAQVFLPDVLAHKEEERQIVCNAQKFVGALALGGGIFGHAQVGAVGHHGDFPFVAVRTQGLDGGIVHRPDAVYFVEKANDDVYPGFGQRLALGVFQKVVVKLGMEGGHDGTLRLRAMRSASLPAEKGEWVCTRSKGMASTVRR